MVSEKRLAANRANAEKSTGPRTAKGKAASSRNAYTHGITAEEVIGPGEDVETLEALAADLRNELRPAGGAQEALFERIVLLTWRLKRIALAEQVALEELELEAVMSIPAGMVDDVSALKFQSHQLLAGAMSDEKNCALERLQLYEMRTERSLRHAMREFAAVQATTTKKGFAQSDEERESIALSFDPKARIKKQRDEAEDLAEAMENEKSNPPEDNAEVGTRDAEQEKTLDHGDHGEARRGKVSCSSQ